LTNQNYNPSHQIATALLLFLLLFLSGECLCWCLFFLSEHGFLLIDFLLITQQHIIAIFVLLALLLDLPQFLWCSKLRLFFELVGEEEVPERVCFVGGDVGGQFWYFGMRRDEDGDFGELSYRLFHEDDGEVSMLLAVGETDEICEYVIFHYDCDLILKISIELSHIRKV